MLIDPGGEFDIQAVKLGTRRSSHITNEMRPEWNPDVLRQDLEMCLKRFPNLLVRSVTATYNCVGMVFATRRTWVEPELVYQFLEDDDYRQLNQIEEVEVGDVVIYKREKDGEITHVGIVIEKTTNLNDATIDLKILSKWGPWAEFIHQPDEVFESYGTITEIWTDRKYIS